MITLLWATASSAFADQTLDECIDQAVNHDGVPPVCTEVNGSWEASWPDDAAGFGGFGVLFVLVVLVGVLIFVWKVSTARRLATESGMDPNLATEMTLLTDSGLEATYLASSLRTPATPATPSSTAARLAELKALLDDGLINQAEYDQQRKAIIDAV